MHESEYLDILPECRDVGVYDASLGHKINHSFAPNCRWETAVHPTFGRIPRIVTLMDLEAGSELTCHYMINMEEASASDDHQWYMQLWEQFSATEAATTAQAQAE